MSTITNSNVPPVVVKPARPWALRALPPFPAVASRILALVDNDDVAAKQITECIKLDPTFTAEILRVANSSLFGVAREIASVRHAVSLLGLNHVKAMATLIAANSMVKPVIRIETLRKFWHHSLVTAILTEESARICNPDLEGAHTAGLLHNLGTLCLMSTYPREYDGLIRISREYGFDLLGAERDLFDIDHCAAGALLAEDWNLPESIVAAIANHHEEPRKSDTLASLVQTCWRLADVLGFEAFPDERAWTYEELIGLMPARAESWLTNGIEGLKSEVKARFSSLNL